MAACQLRRYRRATRYFRVDWIHAEVATPSGSPFRYHGRSVSRSDCILPAAFQIAQPCRRQAHAAFTSNRGRGAALSWQALIARSSFRSAVASTKCRGCNYLEESVSAWDDLLYSSKALGISACSC